MDEESGAVRRVESTQPVPPRPRADLLVRIIGSEVVILDRAAGQVHRLNATASRIWQQCDGSRSVPEIADSVCAEFDATRDQALRDVERTIADLARLGLLVED